MKISSQILPAGCEYLVPACYRGDSQISKCAMVFTWCSCSALCLLQWLPSGRAQVSMVWPHPGAVTLPPDTHVTVSQGNPNISLWSPFDFITATLVFKKEILQLCYSIYNGYHKSRLTFSLKPTWIRTTFSIPYSPPASAKVKKMWIYTSTSIYAFMV
jgi:hypothetical protein